MCRMPFPCFATNRQMGRAFVTMKSGSIDQHTLKKVNEELRAHMLVMVQVS